MSPIVSKNMDIDMDRKFVISRNIQYSARVVGGSWKGWWYLKIIVLMKINDTISILEFFLNVN